MYTLHDVIRFMVSTTMIELYVNGDLTCSCFKCHIHEFYMMLKVQEILPTDNSFTIKLVD